VARQDESPKQLALRCLPVIPDRWNDMVRLFGDRGAYAGCWCMWWRLTRSEFSRGTGDGNKEKMRQIAQSGRVPGILGYVGDQPVGWCSIAPREDFPSLDRSRTLKRVDETAVWSIVCFFVAKEFRRRGLMAALLRAAVDYARARGAAVVEGYPVEPIEGRLPSSAGYMGLVSAFRQAGFREVARRSPNRPIMRCFV